MSDANDPLVVYKGAVSHQRLKPVGHKLKYAVFSFLVDVDRLDDAASQFRWFSRNRFNLFSFFDSDHGVDQPEDISAYIRTVLTEKGYDDMGSIKLLCYPRMLGFVFNPLSVYYCYDKADRLSVMIYEVRNTFGGRHSYLIPIEGERIDQRAQKLLHVSPFNDLDMRYHFKLTAPGQHLSVFIQTSDHDGPVLNATFSGERALVSNTRLLALFFRYPLMTIKVVVGIHWEAAKLFAKGMRLKKAPPDPEHAVTLVEQASMKTSEPI